MNFPVISFDTDLIIRPESYYTQSNPGISTLTTIAIDNTLNLKRDLELTLTPSAPLSSIVISNITNGHVLTIAPSDMIASGEVISIYKDSVYRTSGSTNIEMSASFSDGFFQLEEDSINLLHFTISPAINIDGVFGWIKPSNVSHNVAFAEGFNYTINCELGVKKNNINDKYVNKYYTNNITNDFSIDHLWFETYFIDNEDSTYQIEYKTDDSIMDIQDVSIYLCGCKINSMSWSQTEGDMVKEGIRGNFVKMIKG